MHVEGADPLIPPRLTYEHKTSYLQTNKTWMFIERNYCSNNGAAASAYNDNDLPLGFVPPQPQGSFLQLSIPATIEYQCN